MTEHENTGKVSTPWTPGLVDALNAWQCSGQFHPFTCPNHDDAKHHLSGRPDHLIATPSGWICGDCTYRQFWAWDFMAKTEESA